MIHDVFSNNKSHNNDTYMQKICENVFQKCNHGYKNVACLYLSNGTR